MPAYKFLFPPPAELEVRRVNLNSAGFIAWLSPPTLLLLAASVRFLAVTSGRLISPTAIRNTDTPIDNNNNNNNNNINISINNSNSNSNSNTTISSSWRKVKWILSTTCVSEYGPVYIQLIGLVYTCWLTFLSFRNTGQDYMHLTKQFGHVAVSQLPWQYLLAFKSPRSPFTLVTGLTHERLNAFHRLFGRIIHVLLAVHVILYLNFFIRMGVLEKRIKDSDVRLGVIAFWIFNFLAILSMPIIRKNAYQKLFYRSHVVLTAVIPVALWFHQPWTRWYLLQAAVLYIANGLSRRSARVAGTIIKAEQLAGQDLVKVVVQLKDSTDSNASTGKALNRFRNIFPGEYVYLKSSKGSSLLVSPANPFTVLNVVDNNNNNNNNNSSISNADHASTKLTFVIRTLGGPGTRPFQFQQQQHTKLPLQVPILVEGPYGEARQYFTKLLHEARSGVGQVLVVAGGVGATYALPIYSALAAVGGTRANLIWFVKSTSDARWGIDWLQDHAAFLKNVDIYIKTEPPVAKHDLSAKGGTVHHVTSRPDITVLVEQVLSREANERLGIQGYDTSPITVLVCGPPGLSSQLREALGKYVLTDNREVQWFEEQFGLGG